MNKVILMGRLCKDPDIRYANKGDTSICIARYTIAVDRRVKQGEERSADFISCVAFGKNAEFSEKYLKKGIKIVLEGHLQTGSYTKEDGTKVYTTDVIVEHQEFAENKKNGESEKDREARDNAALSADGFMNIPDGIEEDLPFN